MEKDRELMLIVGKDETGSRMLREFFADIYSIQETENGQEAYEYLKKQEQLPCIILIDLMMPVMYDHILLKRLQQNEIWKNIPAVILNAENTLESDQKLVDLGVCYIIHKPINLNIVREQINNIISVSRKYTLSLRDIQMQKYLMSSRTNSFLCTYYYVNGMMDIADNYKRFFTKEFLQIFSSAPFPVERIVLQKELEKARYFFDPESYDDQDEICIRLRVHNIRYEWFRVTRMLQYYGDMRPKQMIFLFSNIEEEVEANKKLEFIANSDLLTHIPNMRCFSDKVRELMEEYPEEKFLFITMDIYQFRQVNNLFGYQEGDNVLKYLATKLQELIEGYEKGVYGRMASDLFYAFLSETDQAEQMIASLQNYLDCYPLRFELKLCSGIYRVTDLTVSVEDMIKHAAYARRERKKLPVTYDGFIGYYDEKMKKKEYLEEMIISEMDTALKKNQFEVYMQPKCDIDTGKITGAEALVRWKHPEMGYISPGIFIPIFEQNGFVTQIDFFVYEQVCKNIRTWMEEGNNLMPVSVNVSRCDLYDSHLMEHILEIVDGYQIPHSLIEFEITESTFISEKKLLPEFTYKLRSHGFHVLIDDFGSGYSSLNSLKDILVDILKIDIKFLPVSMEEKRATIILSAVIHMAQKLGMQVIAEGVETREQMELLTYLGCPTVQGFYCYRPMPIGEFKQKIKENL